MKTNFQVVDDYDELDVMAKRLRRLAKTVPFDPTSVARNQVVGADSPDLAKHTKHFILGFDNQTYWFRVIFTRNKMPIIDREVYHFYLAETRDRPIPEELAKRLADVFLPGEKRRPAAGLFPPHTQQFFRVAR